MGEHGGSTSRSRATLDGFFLIRANFDSRHFDLRGAIRPFVNRVTVIYMLAKSNPATECEPYERTSKPLGNRTGRGRTCRP
ncbi:hypothetical protein BQ8794_270029 [Mesorhizobium prunaredense]|uniref:Uncharacterized protein n=1 Tax=Mesorhizobium prunaredense TaxID=1631249 RepID=A0A1R3V8H0_9HYPH|nr:hypothetical protein BQ8794_270029 [Mesorhizobium prunaredense]